MRRNRGGKETRKIVPELNMKGERGESSPFQWRRVPLISSIIKIQVPSFLLEERRLSSIFVSRRLEVTTAHEMQKVSKTILFLIFLFLFREKVLTY